MATQLSHDADHQGVQGELGQGGGLPQMVDPAGGGLNVRYLIAAIRSNLTLICIIFMVIFSISVVTTMMMMPRYQATADIQVNNTGGRFLKGQGDDEDAPSSASSLDTERFLQTQVDVMRSRGIAERVARKLHLETSEAFFRAQGRKNVLATATPAAVRVATINLLRSNLTVVLPHNSRVLSLTYESNDSKLSADIANAYVAEFTEYNLQRRYESSRYARDFLAKQLIEVKQKLEESENALNAYMRSAGLIRLNTTPGGGGGATAQQGSGSITTYSLSQINQSYNETKARRIAAEARWNAINKGALLSSTEVVANAGVQQLMTQRAQIVSTLEQDRARHLGSYPTIQAEEAQLAAINTQIQTQANAIRNAIKTEYTAARDAESDLSSQVDKLKADSLNEQDLSVRYGLLAREVDTNRQLYDGLLQRYKELNASAGISSSNISIIDEATIPLRPSSPNLLKNILVGFILAIIITALVVGIKDQLDDSIRIPEDIETKLGIPLLGVVPISTSGNPIGDLDDPKSQVAESYNSIRGALFHFVGAGTPRVITVTSAQPSEGKSTTSQSLAMTFARSGKTVLLIDADLRRPTLHRWLDYDNQMGLSILLAQQGSIRQGIQPSVIPGLSVIPSGPIPPSPTELLSSTRMVELLAEAREMFDITLIDSPPVLGLADSPILSTVADGLVFVVEADRSRHGSLKGALRRLRAMRAEVLGGVLTKFDPLRAGNRYSSYYGYEYYQYQYTYNPRED